jgi:Protein of unknown function (DUF3808)
MQAASEAVKRSTDLSNLFRRKNTVSESFGRLLKRPDYDTFTDGSSLLIESNSMMHSNWSFISDHFCSDQIHAELCYAESLLFKAVLTFTEDENLISFVKGGLKIRSCFQSYKYNQSCSLKKEIQPPDWGMILTGNAGRS